MNKIAAMMALKPANGALGSKTAAEFFEVVVGEGPLPVDEGLELGLAVL